MREDRIRKAVKDGRTLFNAWLTLNNPFLIELIGKRAGTASPSTSSTGSGATRRWSDA